MADAYVQVATEGTGKKIDNTTVTTGAGEVYRQSTSIGDDVQGGARARVRDTLPEQDDYGLVVRQARRTYDSGLITLTDSEAELTDFDTYVDAILFFNQTDQIQKVVVKNDAGDTILPGLKVPAGDMVVREFHGAKLAGIRWYVQTNTGAVKAQVTGNQ